MSRAQYAAGLGFDTLSFTLYLSLSLFYFHGKKNMNPQCSHHNRTNPSPPYCCLYLQTSNKHGMAILFACNRDSVYCLGYRLKARETGGEREGDKTKERQAEQGFFFFKEKKKKKASCEVDNWVIISCPLWIINLMALRLLRR